MLHAIWSVIVGIVVGLIARWLVPGADAMGLIATCLVGIGGSLVGGVIARLFSPPPAGSRFHGAGFLMSIVGAVLLLLAWRYFR